MKFPSPVPVQWIAELIGAVVTGNKNGTATGINEIHKVEEGDLVFVDHPKYYDKCINSAASFIIINKETDVPEGKALLVCDELFEAYLKTVRHFRRASGQPGNDHARLQGSRSRQGRRSDRRCARSSA